MKSILIVYVVFSMIMGNAQVLTGYKNGSWWIISNGKNKQLPNSMSYVGTFDKNKTAVFMENNLYGVLQEDGTVLLSPNYSFITEIGAGLYECETPDLGKCIYDSKIGKNLLTNIFHIGKINNSYKIIEEDSVVILLHINSRTFFTLADSVKIMSTKWNTVYLIENDTSHLIFTEAGDKIQIKEEEIFLDGRYLKYSKDNKTTFISDRFSQTFSSNPFLVFATNYISYYENGKANLLNLESGNVEKSVPFEQIYPAYFGGYFIIENNKKGWMNEFNELKIPIIYDDIYKSDKGYIVTKGELRGKLDEEFKLIVPVAFHSFYNDGNLLRTSSLIGKNGIYSSISHKTILEPIYSKIIINKLFIKAYHEDNIRIIELTNNHLVKSDVILENAITVNQNSFYPYHHAHSYDKRLLDLGWFFQLEENQYQNKFSWGLKTIDDSIIVPAKFVQPIFIPNKHFSLIRQKSNDRYYFKMYNYSTGKKTNNLSIVGIDTMDCLFRTYVRVFSQQGYKIILHNDSIKSVQYVGHNYGKYVPYCQDGKIEYSNKEEQESLPINYYLSNGRFNNSYLFKNYAWNAYTESEKKYKKITNAKWNYLDSLGNDLFSESFEFAQEFKLERAIVKKNGVWGLVSSDSLYIPFKYSEISRIKEFGDTLFIVRKKVNGKMFLDENAKVLNLNYSSIVKSNSNLTVLSDGTIQGVFRNNQLEKTSLSNIILLGDNEYAIKVKKEYVIYGVDGDERGSTTSKPVRLIGNELMIIKNQSKIGLAKIDGEILVQPNNYHIDQIGEFILIKDKINTELLNSNGQQVIVIPTSQQFFIDSISNQIAIIQKNKVKIVDEKGVLVKKLKLISSEPICHFYAGCLFSKTYIQMNTNTLSLGKDFSYKFFKNGYFAVLYGENQIDVYKNGLNNKIFTYQSKNMEEIGIGIFKFHTTAGLVIKTESIEKTFPLFTAVVENFQGGFCLLNTEDSYFFIDESLNNPLNRTFNNATGFKNVLATISMESGWTIVDKQGNQKCYPSYSKIQQLGNGLFVTDKKPLFGIMDQNGKEVIPCVFEKIEILSDGIIKVVKEGEIGYFDKYGKPLFELLTVEN